jgi:hypothetical protein
MPLNNYVHNILINKISSLRGQRPLWLASPLPHHGHHLAAVPLPPLLSPLIHDQPQQHQSAGQGKSQGVAQVVQNVSQVGDIRCQLSRAVVVPGGDGRDVGKVGGASGGGNAVKQEVSWRLLCCSTGVRRTRENQGKRPL